MAGRFPDVRGLVPRTPPEGLLRWILERDREALARGGLIYQAEYVPDYGIASMLEGGGQKKIKMVRATCSCCGGSTLLNWAHDAKYGYGFVLPEDEEGDWSPTVTVSGDEVACPMCEETVLVIKAAELRNTPKITAEVQVMSAGIVGESRLLALTGWSVRRLVSCSGSRFEILPCEAYVFSSSDCAKLEGWRRGYSSYCGYYPQFEARWRQPMHWRDSWEWCNGIYGLTPELIAGSCLPHCKLDVYMDVAAKPGPHSCPVAYLRLYQSHPNVEALLLHGLPLVLREMISREVDRWDSSGGIGGKIALEGIDWGQTRPDKMLHLTRDELAVGRARCWGLWLWEVFTGAKNAGQRLNEQDVENVFRLGDERTGELIPYGHLARDVRYLLRQCEIMAPEPEDEDPSGAIPDVQTLRDYWDMSERLGRNLEYMSVRYPEDLLAAHDLAAELLRQREMDAMASQFRVRRRLLRRYSFMADGLLIRPAASQRELTEEGDALHHCVGTYGRRHATGKTAIFFVRRVSCPREPWYTLELDEKELEVRQNRGKYNCARTPEVQAFEDRWLAWVRTGAPRDKNGRPAEPARNERRRA